MKLYFKPGACSLASHIVLNELNIPFELDQADTSAGTTAAGEDFRVISPNGYVPALRTDEGEVLTENPAVLQYLADSHAHAHLAPTGLVERARLHELLNFVSSELHKAFAPFFSSVEFEPGALSLALERVIAGVEHIEDRLADGRDFLLGEYSVADAYVFVVLTWLPAAKLEIERWPRAQAFVERMLARPAVQRSMHAEGLAAAVAQ